MGIFIETLAITAANIGMRLEWEQIEGDAGNGLDRFGVVTLRPDAGVAKPYSDELVVSRRTSRIAPERRAVDPGALAGLRAVAAEGGQAFTETSDAGLIRRILDRNIDAVFQDLNDRRYHDEIVTWFRYGRAHAARTRDGLEARCMNAPAHELFLSARWPALMRMAGTRPLMRALYRRRLGGAPHIGFLSGPFFDPVASVEAGRCLMRLWLSMHRLGISIHPFGNLVTNADAHHWLGEATGLDRIWLAFRFGYTAPAPRSLRLGVEEILC
jgi:hypothetical protein